MIWEQFRTAKTWQGDGYPRIRAMFDGFIIYHYNLAKHNQYTPEQAQNKLLSNPDHYHFGLCLDFGTRSRDHVEKCAERTNLHRHSKAYRAPTIRLYVLYSEAEIFNWPRSSSLLLDDPKQRKRHTPGESVNHKLNYFLSLVDLWLVGDRCSS